MSRVAPLVAGTTCDEKRWTSRLKRAKQKHVRQGDAAHLLVRSHRTDRCYAWQIEQLDCRCGLLGCSNTCTGGPSADVEQGVSMAAKLLVRSNRTDPSSNRRLDHLEHRSGLLRGCQRVLNSALQVLGPSPASNVVPFAELEASIKMPCAKPTDDPQELRAIANQTPEERKGVHEYRISVSEGQLSKVQGEAQMNDSPNASTLCPSTPDMTLPFSSFSPSSFKGTASLQQVISPTAEFVHFESGTPSAALIAAHAAANEVQGARKSTAVEAESAGAPEVSPEASPPPSRPRFARVSRQQRVKQLTKVIDEFCMLDFEIVAAEGQGGLVLRMLSTLKSLSSQDVYWTDGGEKCKEPRYALLGLQEHDLEAIAKLTQLADELSENRNYRQAHDALCKARPWFRSSPAEIEALRAEWQAAKQEGVMQSSAGLSLQAEVETSSDPDSYRFLPHPIPACAEEFAVVSLNILAGELGRPKTHGFCTPECLDWERRRVKLIEGFSRCLPEVLLLQEVQGTTQANKSDHFTDLKNTLAELGYDLGAYGRLTGTNGTELGTEPKSKSKKKPHIGNAIFFKAQVWQRLAEGRINFAQILAARCVENAAQTEHYASGNQVAVWARLQHIHTERVVVVVSVHIGANWRNPDTQVAQVDVMLNELSQIIQDGDSLIIGGDFNSMPVSGVYNLLSAGKLSADHPDANPKNPKVSKVCGDDGFRSSLRLSSAYAALGGEPEFTTMTGAPPGSDEQPFAGTLDYIWFSPQTLRPVPGTALHMPSATDASKENGGLPNSQIPSDHIPVGCAMSFSLSVKE